LWPRPVRGSSGFKASQSDAALTIGGAAIFDQICAWRHSLAVSNDAGLPIPGVVSGHLFNALGGSELQGGVT